MAPWAYIASVIYHDMFWYPRLSKTKMGQCLSSDWGRLFQNWGNVPETAEGFPDVGTENAKFLRNYSAMLKQSMKVLGTCIVEAPEVAARKRRKAQAAGH
jgi:hypothetical protein